MRVLQLVDSLRLGGAQRLILDIASHLDRERYQVTICGIQTGDAFSQRIEQLGIPLVDLRSPRYSFRPIQQLARMVRENEFDIVHAHLFQARFFAAWLKRRGLIKGLIAHVHSPPIGYPWRLMERFALHTADHVICVSDWTARAYCKLHGIDEDKVEVIYNGVNTALFSGTPLAGQSRAELTEARDTVPTIGYVGRLARVKGVDILLDAARLLAEDGVDFRLVIVGSGPLESRLKAQASDLEQVTFLGSREDVNELLPTLDCFCLPSRMENLPIAALEAMACSVPVVATRVGGVPEVVKNEETGLLVEPENPKALASGLKRVLSDTRLGEALSREGRTLIQSEFSIERTVARVKQTYQRLM